MHQYMIFIFLFLIYKKLKYFKQYEMENETIKVLRWDSLFYSVILNFFIHFLIGGRVLYNFVFVSAVQQLESVIITHISLPSPPSTPSL